MEGARESAVDLDVEAIGEWAVCEELLAGLERDMMREGAGEEREWGGECSRCSWR